MNTKIFVTGGCGYIGSHLVELLIKEGYNVTALAHYNNNNSVGWLDGVKDVQIVHGDIQDQSFIANQCKDKDLVFHLAALIGIPYSYKAPQSYINTNIIGTYNILEACKDKRVLITSTSEVYGSAQYTPMCEKHPKNPQSPYAASKVAADALAMSYNKTYGTPVTVVRPFNTYGPRQSMRAVIPQIILQALTQNIITLGNLDAKRDFLYVADTVSAMHAISKSDNLIGKEVNIATNSTYSIQSIAEIVLAILKKKTPIESSSARMRPKDSEVNELYGIADLLDVSTSWVQVNYIDLGLKKTIKWIEENQHLYKKGYKE